MTDYIGQLRDAVAAVEITSPTSFRWFGAPSAQLPPRVRREIPPETARSHLRFILRTQLYNNFYRVGFASRMAPEVGESSVPCRETHLGGELAQANCGRGSWEAGWEVRQSDDGEVAVRRLGLDLWVAHADCRVPCGAPLAPGAEVALRVPAESFDVSPGYYTALGDEPLVWDGISPLARLYWNVTPAGASSLMHEVTRRLNRAGRPFRLKVLSDGVGYGRCDTAVLYMLKDDLRPSARELRAVHAACRDRLRPGVPALTKPLARGVGLAEDPGDGESFGQRRCEQLAEGLIGAFERRQRGPEWRLRAVADAFEEVGVDLRRPYLRPGADDDYALGLERPASRPARANGARPAGAGSDGWLAVAARIGRRLADDAVWHDARCNWLGLLPHAYGAGQLGLSYGALGDDLYDGTSGIALFLAELSCLTGDATLRRTALGAIRQALHRSEEAARTPSIGLYTGSTGVALAAASVGTMLSERALIARTGRLVRRIATDGDAAGGFDVLSGRAGAVSGLLVLHDLMGDGASCDLAVRLGEDLLESAERTARGWSWRTTGGPSHPNLTGLSHGAAGVGHALAELFAVTGRPAFREGADAAFGYERSWLSRAAGNWPDLREEPRRLRPGGGGTFRAQWCHGAPGIALTRMRAQDILGDGRYGDEARLALETTAKETAEALRRETLSYCLCHGLAGNADILLEGRDRFSGAGPAATLLPETIAAAGVRAYVDRRAPWPCGIPVPGHETPGLMLGLAGIGHFFIRLAFPALVPSLLLLRGAETARGIRTLSSYRGDVAAPRPATVASLEVRP